MFGRGTPKPETAERSCRCEATIAPAVLEGFGCGRADCWRTADVRAAQERFVAELIRRREAGEAGEAGTP